MRITRRALMSASVAAVVLLAGAATASGAGSAGAFGPKRVAAHGRLDRAHAVAGTRTVSRVPAAVRVRTVDTASFTGYENAVYASSPDTVYVAYKRFLQDPTVGGYNPAELRVATSTDGGLTWSVAVLDPDAIEAGDTLDNSVSLDGDRASTVFVVYHTRASGLFADMKLKYAKSTDGGATWSLGTIVDSGAGDQNSVRVLSPSVVVVTAHGAGASEGIHAYTTTNGGATWSDTLVDGGIGNGYYTGVGAQSRTTIWAGYYNSLYPDHTDLHAAHRTGSSWGTQAVKGEGDPYLTGLGASAWVGDSRRVFLAYEDDSAGGAVEVAYRDPGATGWTFATVQADPGIGWNTAVHSVGSNVYVSYWHPVGSLGQAVLGISADGGATWSPLPMPETRNVQPYLDSTAPDATRQFVSYQVYDSATHRSMLRVGRVDP